MEKRYAVLKKIPLKSFIEYLIEVYNDGADFVDIVGKNDEEQDNLRILVRDEYMEEDTTSFHGNPEDLTL